jgi:hypothetical protein
LSELQVEVVHKHRLGFGVCGTICIEYKDAVVFQEYAEVEKVDEDCGRTDQDMREERGIDFAEIPREKAVLHRDQLVSLRMLLGASLTFAINSLFLNSPLTSVTFPCSSNSVQRIFSSLAVLTMRPKLLLKPVPPVEPSSIKFEGASGGWRRPRLPFFDLNIFQAWFVLDVDKERRPMDEYSGTQGRDGKHSEAGWSLDAALGSRVVLVEIPSPDVPVIFHSVRMLVV